jgi:hypothetical protein
LRSVYSAQRSMISAERFQSGRHRRAGVSLWPPSSRTERCKVARGESAGTAQRRPCDGSERIFGGPSLGQNPSRLSGNAILRGRDRCAETTPEVLPIACRDKMRARIPASSGLFATSREISVCVRLRGGPERTRTACQPRSRYRNDFWPVANRLVCTPALESQHFGRATGAKLEPQSRSTRTYLDACGISRAAIYQSRQPV